MKHLNKVLASSLILLSTQCMAAKSALKSIQLMFVVHADKISVTPNKKDDRQASLVMYKPSIEAFSTNPHHYRGDVSLTEFHNYWKHGKDDFTKNPPNAYVPGSKGNKHGFFVKMTDPKVGKNDNIHFTITVSDPNAVEEHFRKAYTVKNAYAFVDDMNWPIGNG